VVGGGWVFTCINIHYYMHNLLQSAAGIITGVVQTPIRQIVERVKSVMQVRERGSQKSPYSWSGACFVDIIRKEGSINV